MVEYQETGSAGWYQGMGITFKALMTYFLYLGSTLMLPQLSKYSQDTKQALKSLNLLRTFQIQTTVP